MVLAVRQSGRVDKGVIQVDDTPPVSMFERRLGEGDIMRNTEGLEEKDIHRYPSSQFDDSIFLNAIFSEPWLNPAS